MKLNLKKLSEDVTQNRQEVIEKLTSFLVTDMLFFWGTDEDLISRQEDVWRPLLDWAKTFFDTDFHETHGLEVSEKNRSAEELLRLFMNNLSNDELAAFYEAALDMRSVLLAAAFVKNRITSDEAFNAAFLEELWQNENWGSDEEAVSRREDIHDELRQIEEFLRS